MKELDVYSKLTNEEKTEIQIKKKQEIDYVLLGSLRPHKGHKLFECNLLNGNVIEAKYHKPKDVTYYINSIKYVEDKKLIIHPDCIYIPALNLKNAKKKFLLNREQFSYFSKPSTL